MCTEWTERGPITGTLGVHCGVRGKGQNHDHGQRRYLHSFFHVRFKEHNYCCFLNSRDIFGVGWGASLTPLKWQSSQRAYFMAWFWSLHEERERGGERERTIVGYRKVWDLKKKFFLLIFFHVMGLVLQKRNGTEKYTLLLLLLLLPSSLSLLRWSTGIVAQFTELLQFSGPVAQAKRSERVAVLGPSTRGAKYFP